MPAAPSAGAELVSIIVPIYREAENIPLLAPRVHQALRYADLE